jgi:hypothetical protein
MALVVMVFPTNKFNLKQYGNTTASIHWEYTHPKLLRNNMITSLTTGQEMTNIHISMTTTRTNTQSITTN